MLFLEYLLFLHINSSKEFYTHSISAFKSDSQLRFCNRVLFKAIPDKTDLNQLNDFMGNTPYTVWVRANTLDQEEVKKLGFERLISFPVMTADITKLADCKFSSDIQVKEIQDRDSILNTWCSIIAQSYNLNIEEFKKFIVYLLDNDKSKKIKFYIGYYNNIPAATSMVIEQPGVLDLHWVGTLPEYRKKGLGFAVSCYPLNILKNSNTKEARLFASTMGKPVYEKIGFKEEYICDVYKNI